MRVLVTGGGGFIGSNLVRHLISADFSVSVLDDFSTGYEDNLQGLDIHLVRGSVLDENTLCTAVAGADSVVHLAALGSVPRSVADPITTHEVNATGTLKLLEVARRFNVGHVIYASSSSVYGRNPALPKSEREWVRPMSPYAVSKLTGEQYVLSYQDSFALESLAFRFFNVYGPRQRPGHAYAAVLPIFLQALIDGRPLPINGSGHQSRDFTYVGSVTKVLADAVARRVSHPEPINLAFGTNTSVVQLASLVQEIVGVDSELIHLPPRIGDVPHSQADNSQLRSLFPLVDPVSLHDGLSETWRWMRDWSKT